MKMKKNILISSSNTKIGQFLTNCLQNHNLKYINEGSLDYKNTKELNKITEEQFQVMQGLESNKKLYIQGPAGSGPRAGVRARAPRAVAARSRGARAPRAARRAPA